MLICLIFILEKAAKYFENNIYLKIILQVVWHESNKVGCGVAHCPTLNVGRSTWPDAFLFVCNYGPGYVLVKFKSCYEYFSLMGAN